MQGRGLGGSSAINAGGAGRGMPADYDGGPLRVARAGDGARCCQRSFVSKMTAISARAHLRFDQLPEVGFEPFVRTFLI